MNGLDFFSFETNRGVGAALNFGLSKIRMKYVAKADADDLNHPARAILITKGLFG